MTKSLFCLVPLLAMFTTASPAQAWELEGLTVSTGYAADRDLGPAWSSYGGKVQLNFNAHLLDALNLEIEPVGAERGERGTLQWSLQNDTALEFNVRGGYSIERFLAGRLVLQGGFRLRHGDQRFDFERMVIRPSEHAPHVLEIRNAAGELMFFIDHIHAHVDAKSSTVTLENMDFRLAPGFAERIGESRHAGLTIGTMRVDSTVHVPVDADRGPEPDTVEGLSCSGRPLWPNTPGTVTDVSLIAIGQVQFMRRNAGAGTVVIAPSATLKNRGGSDAADVPWYRQFTGPRPPYDNDQHPYLAWGVYRLHEGRIEQVGRSGIKHAFFTVNQNCDINCGGGAVLWPGCEDTYGTGNNDSPMYMGPIDEVQAFSGVWESCDSFFDPNCTGNQTQISNGDINRMVVAEADLLPAQYPGAQYVFASWYVVRDDVNIYNTMGWRTINPFFGGSSWSFGPLGSFNNGPAPEHFIPEGTSAADQANERIVTAAGHASVLVNVVALDGGLYRYEYAVQNHDIDVGIDRFSVPLAAGGTIIDSGFQRAVNSGSGGWTFSAGADQVSWTASAPSARQPWMSLFNFWLVTDLAPSSGSTQLRVHGELLPQSVESRVPGFLDPIFGHGFEALP